MKGILPIFLLSSLFASSQNLTKYVNPFIGTGGHGHTYPGATVPFGFVQLSPDTRPDGYNDWDGCSGYHYSDSIIYGFSHTHLSGTGVADYCDILLMPTVGKVQLDNIKNNDTKQGYASLFSHATEKASPGYYSVVLEDDKIAVELSATARVGIHKYQFPDTGKINIILDLRHRDKLLEGSYIEIISATKIQGLRRSSSWAKDQWLYFAMEFSEPFQYAEIKDSANTAKINTQQFNSAIMSGTQLHSFFQFLGDGGKTITVKCALSPVSCIGAWKNMQAEIPHWDFERVKKEADDIWNKVLSKIEVTSVVDEKKALSDIDNKLVIFYTALYHCMLAPNIYEDVDGKYRGRDNKIHVSEHFDYYTVFSLWDTYRALHPLLTIIDQKRTNDFINTFLKQYEQGGRLPVWELSSNETDCMIGYHSVSVIADAAAKGIRGFDMNLAYEAMKHSANLDHFGLKYYKEKGFIESNEEPESVSKTMEYSYDDWCIANYQSLIQQLDFKKDSTKIIDVSIFEVNDEFNFNIRSKNFANLLDSNLFVRPRLNGGWYKPFDPKEVNFNYTEANAWQYSFAYPQYLNELILLESLSNKKGGSKYEDLLDSLFTTSDKTTGRNQSDITGLIGQYAHGNEPSHHIAYLYNTLTPWKTQYYVNKIKNDFYKNSPDGLIGNEDCGQMSAWYVFSAMGFYPVMPGDYFNYYEIGTPSFDSVKIHLENGNIFNLITHRESENSIYIDSVSSYNSGDNFNLYFPEIGHEKIMDGEIFNISLVDVSKQNRLSAYIHPKFGGRRTAPIFIYESSTFKDSITISFELFNSDGYPRVIHHQIFYTLDGSNPDYKSAKYDGPFTIYNSTTIKAKLGQQVSTARFTKLSHNYKLKYLTKYNSQYTAGGETALIDGMHGGADFRTGMWQGWQKENMEVVLDLGEIKTITKAGAGFLQDVRSWIWMPAKVEIYTSTDGEKYSLVATLNNTTETDNYESKEIKQVEATLNNMSARYVKYVAFNFGSVPAWHPGKGGDTWIFCDEVWVE